MAIGPASTATGTNSVALGNGATAGNAGGVALGSGSTTSLAVGTPGATINGTYYAFAGTSPTSTVSVGAAGSERTVTNVAAGQLSASSTDAVNGSQLYATNQAVTTLGTNQNTLGTSVASALGGGSTYNPATGISVPSYNVYGSTQTSVGGAISALQTMSPIQYSDSSGNPTLLMPGDNVTLVGTGGPVLLHNVAAGVAPTDAANVSQLPGSWQTPTSNTFVFNNVSGPGGQVTLGNVAPGAITATSTQAVNGSQLYAINQSVGGLSQSLTQLRSQVNSNFNELAGGIASAMALGTMRFDDRPGKLSAGVGVSGFDGQMGFAGGAGYTSPDQNWRFSAGVAFSPTATKPDIGGAGSLVYTFN